MGTVLNKWEQAPRGVELKRFDGGETRGVCYQITNTLPDEYVTLTKNQLLALMRAIAKRGLEEGLE